MNKLKKARFFVTGATGYIGSFLTKRLVEEGCRVSVLVRPSSNTCLLETILNKIDVHVYDGTYESIELSINSSRPDIVFHLSSFASIKYQSNDIHNMINSNILLGTFLAEAMAKHQVKHLVNTSSYSQHYNQKPYLPNSLYAATKQAFEDILLYYSRVWLINVVHLVLFDNFGPKDPRPKIMNLLYRAMTEGKTLSMSPGEQYLDLLYIDDLIEAYLVAATRLLANETQGVERFTVSSGQHIKLKELVHLFEHISGGTIPVKWGELDYRPGEIMVPWTKGISLPAWKQRTSLEAGIRLLIGENRVSNQID